MDKISAIVLNSDKRDITKTLKSIAWCDEVIVLDKPINGDFAKARNEAMATAKYEWVLFVDYDETVEQIPIIDNKYDGYYLKRHDVFWGKKLKYGEVGSIKLLRLGKKTAGVWKRKVHEYWDIKNYGYLPIKIMHYPHPTVKSFIDQINTYTEIDAKELLNDGKNFSYFRLFANPAGKFINNYLLKLGFLDGWTGFVYAFMMSFYSLTVRVKMAANGHRNLL